MHFSSMNWIDFLYFDWEAMQGLIVSKWVHEYMFTFFLLNLVASNELSV